MKISDYKKYGVTRTQAAIMNSYLELIQSYSPATLPVTTICLEADVGRATFYRNFDSKEDILKLYIKLLTEEYFASLHKVSDLTLEKLANVFFGYWRSERVFLRILHENNMFMVLLEETQDIETHMQSMNSDLFPKSSDDFNELENTYFHSFYFAGFWRLIHMWTARDFKESVDEMTNIFLNIHNVKMSS
jgi:AcrR family transcriptional regulator